MSLQATKDAYRAMSYAERNQFISWMHDGCPGDPSKALGAVPELPSIQTPLDVKTLQQQHGELSEDWLARLSGTDQTGMTAQERYVLGNRQAQAKALTHKEESDARDADDQRREG